MNKKAIGGIPLILLGFFVIIAGFIFLKIILNFAVNILQFALVVALTLAGVWMIFFILNSISHDSKQRKRRR